MPPQRQVRVGNQWMRAKDAQRALEEAIRISREEEASHGPHQSFISKYVFSVDHKWIGIQYGVTALCFLMLGFSMMLLMRFQLAWPGKPFHPLIAKFLGAANAPGGVMLPEFYNQLGAMHGTVKLATQIKLETRNSKPETTSEAND